MVNKGNTSPKHNPRFSPSQCSFELCMENLEENARAAKRMKQDVKQMDELLQILCPKSKERSRSFFIKRFISKLQYLASDLEVRSGFEISSGCVRL